MFEVLTRWSGVGAGGLNVMYFDELATIEVVRSLLNDFWGDVGAYITDDMSWSIDQVGRVLNPATGSLEGQWADSTPYADNGGAASSVVPDVAQVLFRWRTEQIRNGRFIQGRTFVPGFTTGNLTDGNLSSGTQTALNAAITTFLAAPVGLLVWSRPVDGAGGVPAPVESGAVWAEMAVQRGRRG
jgi:hypothetical protein